MVKGLTGQQKAAILMMVLGPENSSQIVRFLNETEVEQLTIEIAQLKKISAESRDEVITEFYHTYMASDYMTQGGIEYAREVLEKALGEQKAFEIINKLFSTFRMRPFDLVSRADPRQLLSLLQGEHPQTIALIMAHLPTEKGAALLSNLPPELQAEVAKRIAMMGRTSPEVLKEVENVLDKKISGMGITDFTTFGGILSLVNLLNRADPGTYKTVMDSLENDEPELADQIRAKLFVFQDIILLDDRSIQMVLREVENKDLVLALKGSNNDVINKVVSNMSARAAQMLREEIDYLGPVRLREVENAQQRIIKIIRRMEEIGAIVVPRGGGDELVY